jgi:hypothetical protein
VTTPAPLVKVVQTCIAAPSQWLAWDADGTQLYLRYRHGRGRVEYGDGSQREAPIYVCWDDRGGSHMSLEKFMAKADLTLAPDAEVTPLDDEDDSAGGLAAPPGPPTPFLEGTFALYQTPDRALILAYRAKGTEEDRQLMIPPFILQMAGQASGLSPDDILSRIQSGSIDG